jgi:hypothetical protein
MSITRILLYILLAYFLYKFVFGFLVPVVKMSWRVRRQVKEFQRQHQQQQDPLQNNTSTTGQSSAHTPNASAPKSKAGEYIDFEEVKE